MRLGEFRELRKSVLKPLVEFVGADVVLQSDSKRDRPKGLCRFRFAWEEPRFSRREQFANRSKVLDLNFCFLEHVMRKRLHGLSREFGRKIEAFVTPAKGRDDQREFPKQCKGGGYCCKRDGNF